MRNLNDVFSILIVLVLLFGFVGCAKPVPVRNVTPEVSVEEVIPEEPEVPEEKVEPKKPVSAKELCVNYNDLPREKRDELMQDNEESRSKTRDDVDEESLALGWKEGCVSYFYGDYVSTMEGDLANPLLYSSVSKYPKDNIGKVILKPEDFSEDTKIFPVPKIGDEAIGYYYMYQIGQFTITSFNVEFIKDDIWALVSYDAIGTSDLRNAVIYYAKRIEQKI